MYIHSILKEKMGKTYFCFLILYAGMYLGQNYKIHYIVNILFLYSFIIEFPTNHELKMIWTSSKQ